jgi:hypothetical protein
MDNRTATVDNFPRALIGIILPERTYKFNDDSVIAGKSILVNKVGRTYLYMGDDPRRSPAQQIIVQDVNGADLHFLSMDCKKSIQLMGLSEWV